MQGIVISSVYGYGNPDRGNSTEDKRYRFGLILPIGNRTLLRINILTLL